MTQVNGGYGVPPVYNQQQNYSTQQVQSTNNVNSVNPYGKPDAYQPPQQKQGGIAGNSSTNKSYITKQTVMTGLSGAVIGFMVGGPIGAAIGAVIGLLLSIIMNAIKIKKEEKNSANSTSNEQQPIPANMYSQERLQQEQQREQQEQIQNSNNINANTNSNTNSVPSQPLKDDMITKIGSTVGMAAAGGFASFKFSSEFSSSVKTGIESVHNADSGMGNKIKATLPSAKQIGMTSLKAAGVGALVAGGFSAITNMIDVMRGKKTGAEAVGTAVADASSGAIGGVVGVTAGGLATFAFSSLSSTPLMIVGVTLGAVGAVVADKLFKGTGGYDAIKNSVMKMMGKS